MFFYRHGNFVERTEIAGDAPLAHETKAESNRPSCLVRLACVDNPFFHRLKRTTSATARYKPVRLEEIQKSPDYQLHILREIDPSENVGSWNAFTQHCAVPACCARDMVSCWLGWSSAPEIPLKVHVNVPRMNTLVSHPSRPGVLSLPLSLSLAFSLSLCSL